MTLAADVSQGQLHLIAGGHDRMVASTTTYPWGVDCNAQACLDRLDDRTLISPDGAYISFVQNWGGPTLRLWNAQGKLLLSIDSQFFASQSRPLGTTMSVWSGTSLYWRDDKGIQRWRGGTQSLVLPGVAWIRPKGSPAGDKIVYFMRDSSRIPSVYLLDTATESVRQLATMRSEPAFLTSRYIWYQGERHCTAQDTVYACGSAVDATTTTGVTYIYDLATGVESQSIITNVWDVWPHAA